jgi:hypothetical protein
MLISFDTLTIDVKKCILMCYGTDNQYQNVISVF